MATENTNPEKSNKTLAIILASIPVIGIIVVAIINKPPSPHPQPTEPKQNVEELRNKGGKINDAVVFGRYIDVAPLMSEDLRLTVRQPLFDSSNLIVFNALGDFVKPIDTTYSEFSGNDQVIVKNQYKRGVRLIEMLFDKQGQIIGLISRF